MVTPYTDIPILHAFEAILKDAFHASDETDLQKWCDEKKLHDLVDPSVAEEFYVRWSDPDIPSDWKRDVQFSLGDQLNRNPANRTVLVVQVNPKEIVLRRASTAGEGTWIDKNS